MTRSGPAPWRALLVLAVLGTACYSVPEQAKIEIGKRVDCATAERDLAFLADERATIAERVSAGLQAIEPAEAVLSLIGGAEGEKVSVAVGEYNDGIDAKAAEIREECGIE